MSRHSEEDHSNGCTPRCKSTFEEVYNAITKLVDRYALDLDWVKYDKNWDKYDKEFREILAKHGWTRQEYNSKMSAGDDY